MRTALALIALLLHLPCAHAAMDLGAGRTLEFASATEGARLLGASDEFVERMSPFDRAARLKSAQPVSQAQYLAFVAGNVLPWQDAERAALQAAFDSVRERLVRHLPALPKTVYLVQTTGKEEGGAAYTRGAVVVFPRHMLSSSREVLAETLSHELFHVLSRQDSALRERLYAVIGFEACPEVVLPGELAARRITNPDAPRNDHRIRLRLGEEAVWAVPVLYSSSAAYDLVRGGEFFDYLKFQMLLQAAGASPGTAPRLVDLGQLAGFTEQVGKNTDYVIHPEEILAVNFSYLVVNRGGLPSPEIPERMARLLSTHAGEHGTKHAPEQTGHDEHAGHAAADAALQLDDGKRWATDAPLRASMERIRAALHARGARGGSSEALAREIDEAIGHMVRNCKLPPRADATLHALIARLGAASGALRQKPENTEALDEVAAVLRLYAKYFEHPGWTGEA